MASPMIVDTAPILAADLSNPLASRVPARDRGATPTAWSDRASCSPRTRYTPPQMSDPKLELDPVDLARLPVFPLPNAVLFPGALLPLHVFEERYREMMREIIPGRRRLAVARLRPGFEADYYGRPPVFEVCGVGAIVRDAQRDDGRYDILVRGIQRVRLLEELAPKEGYRTFRAEALFDQPNTHAASVAAWQKKLSELWQQLKPHLPNGARDLHALVEGAGGPGESADRIAEALVADPDDRQTLLEELDPAERLGRLVSRLSELVSALSPGSAQNSRALN